MKNSASPIAMLTAMLLSVVSTFSSAEGNKEDLAYVALANTQLEFERIEGSKKATAYAGTLILGTYITDYVKTEFRAGLGITDDEIFTSTTPDAFGQRPSATIALDYFYSWYMGPQYPISEYFIIYGLAGFTHMVGEVEYSAPERGKPLPDELTESTFSMSYVIGADIKLYKSFWGVIEYGRLHRDTITEIRTNQLNFALKYEF